MTRVKISCTDCRAGRHVEVHADDYDRFLKGTSSSDGYFPYLSREDRQLMIFGQCTPCAVKPTLPEDSGSRLGNLARALRDSAPLVLTETQRQVLAVMVASNLTRFGVLATGGEVDAWLDEANGR